MAARVPDPELCERLRRGAERAAAKAAAVSGVHSVVLFGSVAYGTADECSDVDVAVIADRCSKDCTEAVHAAFKDEIRDADTQIVWMTPDNGYAGADETGGLGREAVRLGALLEDDGAWEQVYEMTRHTKAADEGRVTRRQETTLNLVAQAARDWSMYRERRSDGNLSALGRSTSDAGELLLKNGLGYRGVPTARSHVLPDVLREALNAMKPGKGEIVPTVFEEEREGEFTEWAEQRMATLDGKTSTDRLAIYGEGDVPEEEDQRRRIPAILGTALEEHEALCEHSAMQDLAKECANAMEGVRRATYGLRNDPDPAVAAAAKEWAGPLERAADRGYPWTLFEPERRDAKEAGLRNVEDNPRQNELVLTRWWDEDEGRREERCKVSYPPDAGEAKIEAMKRAWTSGRVTPDGVATPAERAATRRALAEPPPGKDPDLLAAPVEGTATGAATEEVSSQRTAPSPGPGRGSGPER